MTRFSLQHWPWSYQASLHPVNASHWYMVVIRVIITWVTPRAEGTWTLKFHGSVLNKKELLWDYTFDFGVYITEGGAYPCEMMCSQKKIQTSTWGFFFSISGSDSTWDVPWACLQLCEEAAFKIKPVPAISSVTECLKVSRCFLTLSPGD